MLAYVLKMVWFVNLSGAYQVDHCNAVDTNTDAKVYKVAVNSRQKFHSWEPKNPQSSFLAKLLIREESGQSLEQFYCCVNTVESTLLTRISIFIISDHGEESWQLVPMARCKYFLGWLNDRLHNFLVLENFIDHVFEIKDLIYFLWSQLRVVRRPICSDQVFFWSAALVRSWHNSKKIRIELWVTFMIT